MSNYYLGTITEVLDPDLYKIRVDLPGLAREVEAFPMRGELDEPRKGDLVIVRDVDPVFHSFYLYSELKEDEFIGIRSRGKMIEINKEEIKIGIFDLDEKYENQDPPIPKLTSWIKIDKEGNMEIKAEKDISIKVEGDVDLKAKNTTVTSEHTEFKGGTVEITGTAGIGNGMGPFCGIRNCPVLGAFHGTNTVKTLL